MHSCVCGTSHAHCVRVCSVVRGDWCRMHCAHAHCVCSHAHTLTRSHAHRFQQRFIEMKSGDDDILLMLLIGWHV